MPVRNAFSPAARGHSAPVAAVDSRVRRVRPRRSAVDQAGWSRRRRGRGWSYHDELGEPILETEQLERIRGLAIPPAWTDVWVCPFPNGHLQAVGTDAKGRRQYLYHRQWRTDRDGEKHQRVLEFGARLPAARLIAQEHLCLPGLPQERVLAAAFRLLDLGLFRVGGEAYAQENGSYGLATLRREHVRVTRGTLAFTYTAKSGVEREVEVCDPGVLDVVAGLRRRRGGGEELLAWRPGRRGRWRDVTSSDINGYVKSLLGEQSSAKDFRTWHATVLAAVALAGKQPPSSRTATGRQVSQAIREVSEQLGNTPAVCKASYIDPRVVDGYLEGATVGRALRRAAVDGIGVGDPAVERAVLRLLRSR
jgi:DNA topoisomerase IB